MILEDSRYFFVYMYLEEAVSRCIVKYRIHYAKLVNITAMGILKPAEIIARQQLF